MSNKSNVRTWNERPIRCFQALDSMGPTYLALCWQLSYGSSNNYNSNMLQPLLNIREKMSAAIFIRHILRVRSNTIESRIDLMKA